VVGLGSAGEKLPGGGGGGVGANNLSYGG